MCISHVVVTYPDSARQRNLLFEKGFVDIEVPQVVARRLELCEAHLPATPVAIASVNDKDFLVGLHQRLRNVTCSIDKELCDKSSNSARARRVSINGGSNSTCLPTREKGHGWPVHGPSITWGVAHPKQGPRVN